MQSQARVVFAAALLICLIPVSALAITPYSQDFETFDLPSEAGLLGDGWLVYASAFTPLGVWAYGYGAFPAPNDGAAFCAIAEGEGGDDQGTRQLSVYSDYENLDHANMFLIESNVFQEQTVTIDDVGDTWFFDFDAKMGNVEGASTAAAFIKTIDPSSNYDMTNFVTVDMTTAPATWQRYSISLEIDAGLVGQLIQFGFINTATNYEGSGIFYDNLDFYLYDPTDVPDVSTVAGATLRQNFPNPFNPSTRIEFSTERAGIVDLSVFDLAGRRVATLHQGNLDSGDHYVTWNGRADSGFTAPTGQYRYVLKTPAGSVSRSMVLLK